MDGGGALARGRGDPPAMTSATSAPEPAGTASMVSAAIADAAAVTS